MANQVGQNVLYQPTIGEWPTGYYQHAAIITGWDEATQKANLLVFPDGANYVISKNQVVEGTMDGTFQQLGVTSRSAETKKAHQQQADQIFKQMSGVTT
jgi:hypothetical protein